MFFSGRAKKADYGGGKRGGDDQEDLLAKLAAERLERQAKRNFERLVVVVQSLRRRKVVLMGARAEFRALFDGKIAEALASKSSSQSDVLA